MQAAIRRVATSGQQTRIQPQEINQSDKPSSSRDIQDNRVRKSRLKVVATVVVMVLRLTLNHATGLVTWPPLISTFIQQRLTNIICRFDDNV